MLRGNFFRLSIFSLIIIFAGSLYSQDKGPRKSLRASVSQTIGTDTEITIVFGRPGVKGRTIWGDLIPMGMAKRDNKSIPWRAGADENTTIEFSKDVTVEGKDLKAGKYGLHMIPGEKEWVVIFSKTSDSWGSYSYDEANDALRVTVKPLDAPHQEWLTYGFDDLAGTSGTAYLHWEMVKVPFKITAK